MSHNHYKKDVKHLDTLDVYRVLDLFNVTNPALQHAAKKILCAGERGAKSRRQDIQEAIDSLNRALEMMDEDSIGLNGLCDRLRACQTRQNAPAHTEVRVEPTNALQALKPKGQMSAS